MAINPDRYQTHIDRPNQAMLIGYLQDESQYQAKDLCSVVPSDKQSDLFFSAPASQWMRSGAQTRAPATMAPRINYNMGVKRFDCEVVSVAIDLDDISSGNYDAPLNPEQDAVELIGNDMRLQREIRAYKALMRNNFWQGWSAPNDAPGVFRDFDPSDTYAGGQWDQPNATITADVAKILKSVGKRGFRPKGAWMARNVADALKNNPAIYGRYSGVVPQFLTDDQLANILGIPNLKISEVTYNSAQERQADRCGYLLDNEMLIFYGEEGPTRMKPRFASCFTWTGLPGAGGQEALVKRYRREEIASLTLEAWAAYKYEPICLDLAVKVVNVLKNP